MALRWELLDKIDCYLTGASNECELEGWVVGHLQLILNSGETETIRLADEIDASFIEVGERIIDEATLRHRLSKLVADIRAAS